MNTLRLTNVHLSLEVLMARLSDDNSGALRALKDITRQAPITEPYSPLGEYGPLYALDHLGCYGPRIWCFYHWLCKGSPIKVLGLLRAMHLGIITRETLNQAIDGRIEIDVGAIMAKVVNRIVAFGMEYTAAELPQKGKANG